MGLDQQIQNSTLTPG